MFLLPVFNGYGGAGRYRQRPAARRPAPPFYGYSTATRIPKATRIAPPRRRSADPIAGRRVAEAAMAGHATGATWEAGAMTTFDTSQTDLLLSTTRAVRKRLDLDRPVEPEVLLECLELAHQAPIGGNNEVRKWVVVTEPEPKLALADMYRKHALPYLEAKQAAGTDDVVQQRVGDSALFLAHNLERVPVLVVACLAAPIDLSSNASAAPTYGSVMPGVWSFQLALRSRGLGSAWTTLHLGSEAAAAELLGIPEGISQVALLPVAYTKGTDFKAARRDPIREHVSWNRWGQTAP